MRVNTAQLSVPSRLNANYEEKHSARREEGERRMTVQKSRRASHGAERNGL